MYLPSQFRQGDTRWALTLMREHPLACLVSGQGDGLPVVSHLPLLADVADDTSEALLPDGAWNLLGHCARANPHWQLLQRQPRALVLFQGPQAYLSPAVYPDLARVPTWNYLVVECEVEARLIDEASAKDALLKRLIGRHEPSYAAQWRGLEAELQQRLLNGIVGLELRVLALNAKFKLNQHRPESHAAMHARYAAGAPDERALATWMERLGWVDVKGTRGGSAPA